MFNRNLIILIFAQIFSFTVAPVTVLLSGIIASEMISIKYIATLPTALTIVGTALGSIFASYLMSIKGRKFGFAFSSLMNSLAALLASYAVLNNYFVIYCFANLILGLGLAFTAQYRFAAAESVEKQFIPLTISIILLSGLVSAVIGPNIATISKDIISSHLYVGSYLFLSLLTFIPFCLFIFFKNEKSDFEKKVIKGRSYFTLLAQPRFFQAVISAAIGYIVMSFLMTATPIEMHIIKNMSLNKTGFVIQMHIFGMFLPSLFTGSLIKKFGHSKIIYIGVLILITCIIVNFSYQHFYNYLIGLILLGIGWNFLFISGTSLLIISYKPEEKFKAQGLNDFLVFSTQATGALAAGYLLYLTNWQFINILCLPLLLIVFCVTLYSDKIANVKK
ncbi:MAG: hypothetical protein CFH18_00145 [Alphaproteobacteria bacterium MarineAlpha5_Bin8]|nr:MAG: hypothetical protein CFH17_01192 [Alphaproteobacteria bacterium MarineAlpha5_Bin7]PPR48247.1 MAG: hypothetical protein CFH18_00145 [Alphaproteobacteria bacterium MarineAlpha5_Bin8]PPR54449.1 MAG: hypothetical protein CFH16_00398 [Alphaproteobacteria bacterium MarineAlpha5_Bin6]|tara:strand:- start:8538 stop:9710 length:1173 start_codon:yes stop_codon:yes gene_type:complete